MSDEKPRVSTDTGYLVSTLWTKKPPKPVGPEFFEPSGDPDTQKAVREITDRLQPKPPAPK